MYIKIEEINYTLDSNILRNTTFIKFPEQPLGSLILYICEFAHQLLFYLPEPLVLLCWVPCELPGEKPSIIELNEVLINIQELSINAWELGLQLFFAQTQQFFICEQALSLGVVSCSSYLSVITKESTFNNQLFFIEGLRLVEKVELTLFFTVFITIRVFTVFFKDQFLSFINIKLSNQFQISIPLLLNLIFYAFDLFLVETMHPYKVRLHFLHHVL